MSNIFSFIKSERAFFVALLVVVALTRLIPHIPNVSPVAAMALFGGCFFNNRRWAFGLPMAVLFFSDLLLQIGFWLGWRTYTGFHDVLPYVYGSMLLITLVGMRLQQNRSLPYLVGASLFSSILFFVITNFGVWYNWMPHNSQQLVQCYVQAIPFFRNTLLGDLLYVGVLFGVTAWVNKKYFRLAKISNT